MGNNKIVLDNLNFQKNFIKNQIISATPSNLKWKKKQPPTFYQKNKSLVEDVVNDAKKANKVALKDSLV